MAGGINRKWKNYLEKKAQNHIEQTLPHGGEDMGGLQHEIIESSNVGIPKTIDNSKLLFPIHLDFNEFETQEELFNGMKNWWIYNKRRAEKAYNF